MIESKSIAGWPQPKQELRQSEPGPERRAVEDARESEGHTLQEVVWTWASELRRSWRMALLAFALAVVPIVSYALFSIPTYTSSGVVQVTSMLSVNPLIDLTGGTASVETEIELMRRREFLLLVFKDLRLNIADPEQPRDLTLDLDVSLRGASTASSAVAWARAAATIAEVLPHHPSDVPLQISALDAQTMRVVLGEGRPDDVHDLLVGARLKTETIELQFSRLPVAVGATIALVLRSDGALLVEMQDALTVSMVGGRNNPTNLVRVAFSASDRAMAQAVVARLMERYVEQSLSWQASSAKRSVDFISTQLTEATEKLAAEEDALRVFSERERTVQLDTQAQATVEKIASLEAEGMRANLQERMMDHVLGDLDRRVDRGSALLTANFFEDPVLAASIASLTENETKYEVLKATLTREHPQVLELAAQVKQQQKQVTRLMRSARSNLATRTGALEAQLKATIESLEQFPDKQLQLARLLRAVTVSERLYGFLLEKYNEAEILEASTATDKRVVDAASFPHNATAPRRGRMIATGLATGLIFAFGAIYIARTLRRTLGSVEAITDMVDYPVYGLLPALVPLPADETVVLGATWLRGPNATAEAARTLAVSVRLALPPTGGGRVVQVTSSGHGEGKSSVLANLAVALARMDMRVLLVDLDLRSPAQHRIFGVPRTPGYVELVTEPSDPERARRSMHRDARYRVRLLTAGAWSTETSALLMGNALPTMLAYWATEYDYILIDGPPAFVPDTWAVAPLTDLLLLIARPGALERGELRRSLELLAPLSANKGLVLNAVMTQHLGFGAAKLEAFDKYRSGGPEETVDDVVAPLG